MKPYDWVADGGEKKFFRAVELLKKTNQPVTEEAVRELYVKWGGLVWEKVEEAPAEEKVEESSAEEEVRPRRGRPARVDAE